jgi:hypothetical protein
MIEMRTKEKKQKGSRNIPLGLFVTLWCAVARGGRAAAKCKPHVIRVNPNSGGGRSGPYVGGVLPIHIVDCFYPRRVGHNL